MAVAVIAWSLLVIRQYFVCLGYFLEFFLSISLVFAVGIRVVLTRHLAVSLLDFRLRRIPTDAEHIIVVPLGHESPRYFPPDLRITYFPARVIQRAVFNHSKSDW